MRNCGSCKFFSDTDFCSELKQAMFATSLCSRWKEKDKSEAKMEERNLNLEKLIKMLKMTSSSNDAEALVALRMANQHLKSCNWDWDKLLRSKVTVVADPFMTAPVVNHTPSNDFGSSPNPPSSYNYQATSRPTPRPRPIYQAPKPKKPKRVELTLDDLDII